MNPNSHTLQTAKAANLCELSKQTEALLAHTPAMPPHPVGSSPELERDRRENDRSSANRGKSPTRYFQERVSRAWCPPGDFERRLDRTVAGRPGLPLETKLGGLLRLVEMGAITHRQAREMAEKFTAQRAGCQCVDDQKTFVYSGSK